MSICYGGVYQDVNCPEFCVTLGFVAAGCVEPDGCDCGDLTDEACITAVNAFCSCLDGTDSPCVEGDPVVDPLSMYITCHTGNPPEDATFLQCFGMQAEAGTDVTCADAAMACQ
jgi:hypothetical protein